MKYIIFIDRETQIVSSPRIGFEEFPDVAIVLDCSVQEIPMYAGSFSDVKIFYSNKHKKYCVKKEYAHLPNGKVCFVSNFFPGSKHDFSVFLANLEIYKKFY
jgi:hypothetical protein